MPEALPIYPSAHLREADAVSRVEELVRRAALDAARQDARREEEQERVRSETRLAAPQKTETVVELNGDSTVPSAATGAVPGPPGGR